MSASYPGNLEISTKKKKITFQIYKLFELEKREFLIMTITECREIGMGRNVHETVLY